MRSISTRILTRSSHFFVFRHFRIRFRYLFGEQVDLFAETVDIFPPLAELAGLPAPQGPQSIDGISLVPVLKDANARVRDHAFHAYPRKLLGRAIRTDRYRMVAWRNPGQPLASAQYELYDYQDDPNETRNHASQQPEIVQQLAAKLAKYPEPVRRNKRRSK